MTILQQILLFVMVGLTSLSANAGHHESEKAPKSDLKVAVDQLMGAFEKESVEIFDRIIIALPDDLDTREKIDDDDQQHQ